MCNNENDVTQTQKYPLSLVWRGDIFQDLIEPTEGSEP